MAKETNEEQAAPKKTVPQRPPKIENKSGDFVLPPKPQSANFKTPPIRPPQRKLESENVNMGANSQSAAAEKVSAESAPKVNIPQRPAKIETPPLKTEEAFASEVETHESLQEDNAQGDVAEREDNVLLDVEKDMSTHENAETLEEAPNDEKQEKKKKEKKKLNPNILPSVGIAVSCVFIIVLVVLIFS